MALIQSNGNGKLEVSKTVGMFIAIITLVSLIWNFESYFLMKTTIEPMQQEICAMKVFYQDFRANYNEHLLASAQRDGVVNAQLASVQSKLDLILEQISKRR